MAKTKLAIDAHKICTAEEFRKALCAEGMELRASCPIHREAYKPLLRSLEDKSAVPIY